MKNSSVLFDSLNSNVNLSDIKELINAYNALPSYYLEQIQTELKKHIADYPTLECKIGATINNYLDVWEDDVYRKHNTWQWLSMTANHDSLKIYLVSNEKDSVPRDEKADLIGYKSSQQSSGNTWYEPEDKTKFQIDFNGQIPNFEKIASHIMKLLEELRTVKEKYANSGITYK